ncbi:terminase large subunit [Clostridiaceae bacterium 14S0207]|nr:terminase large subunit [Clostridiaceae bacterium 14S0207]
MSKFAKLFTRIYTYAVDIVEGRLKACKKHKQACKRFLDDLEKSKDKDYTFQFDYEELYNFYKWTGMFKHRVGILKGNKIDLVDFQLFLVGNIFCWKEKETGYRRFRKVYIQLARKNAKSQLLALISSYVCFLSDEQQECYISGWTKKQSKIVYKEMKYQLEGSDFLRGKWKESYGVITHLKSGSIIEPLSKEAKNNGDGDNPSLGICDEYHQHKTDEIYESILSGMGARTEPLMVIITTAGVDLNGPCYKEYQYVSKILDPNLKDITNDEYFVMICELDKGDDIKDESNWIKSNPILATYHLGLRKIRSELKAALDAPEKMTKFKTKYMDIWVNARENGYMNMQKWDTCENKNLSLADFKGEECTGGLDLSTKLDLTSIAFEFKRNGKYYPFQHSFIPQEAYDNRLREGKYPFDLWRDQGYLTVTPGAVIDYEFVKQWIQDKERENNLIIKEIGYDPYNATQFVQEMEQEGYVMVEVRQGPFTLNEPTKDFRDQVYDKALEHSGDGLLTWAISNAVTKENAQEFIMLDKAKSSEKIDPIAATINAHVRGMLVLEDNTGDIFYSPDI